MHEQHKDNDKDNAAASTTVLPLIPLRNGVVFPGTEATLPVGRAKSVALLKTLHEGDIIGLALQRDAKLDEPTFADLLPIGVHAKVNKIIAAGNDVYRLVVQAQGRFELRELIQQSPFLRAKVLPLLASTHPPLEAQARAQALLDRLGTMGAALSEALRNKLASLDPQHEPGLIADVVAAALRLPAEKEGELLLLLDADERLQRILVWMDEMDAFADVRQRINSEVRQGFSEQQRKAVLRQQLAAIQKELGEGDDDDVTQLRKKLTDAQLPAEAQEHVDREIKRLVDMGSSQVESHVIRRHLELIAELPWQVRADINEDIDAIAAKLDADHHGLDDVKKRIKEHIAVRTVTGNKRGAILCLVGPPGVGKTSIGQSIADATKRPFVRSSLGGIRDEAEIRGHRRTYVGALPGRIIGAMRQAKVKNPVIMLDEIDKLSNAWMGSPEAALLEVLDPEQNARFVDNYLELSFDLAEVLFICTANSLDGVSPALRDRLDIVEIQGYTIDEKVVIAQRHLLPKQLIAHGLCSEQIELEAKALENIVVSYTREAGVRQLGRELEKICRAVTLDAARNTERKLSTVHVTVDDVHTYLGKIRFFDDAKERTALPGVVMGLAWTPVGGDVLFIETSRMPGTGKLEITGQLGDVMKESAQAALSYIRSHAQTLGVDVDFLKSQDIHIHVPSGAIPKDGPSAGITIFTALASLLTGRQARADTAMTGECTLRGRVLPVGGIKSKILAAHRHGIKRVIMPERNRRDLDDVPSTVQQSMEFVWVTQMQEALAAALEAEPVISVVQDVAGTHSGSTLSS